MPRIRWPLGTVRDTNASTTTQKPEGSTPEAQASPEKAPAEPVPKTAASTSKKRKSTEAASTTPPAAKKTKGKSRTTKDAAKAAKETLRDAASKLLDVSSAPTPLEDEDDDGVVAVYDTCDTVRRKIRAILAKDGITQAAFLRAIVTATYGEASTKKIQSVSLNAFLKQKGPLAGNTNATYYAAYVFFEKLRIKQKKPKSEDREIMEELHPNGVDTKVQFGKASYVGATNTTLRIDKYGKLHSFLSDKY